MNTDHAFTIFNSLPEIMASTEHNEASRIELSLGALIEDLRNSNGDINDVQQLNKQIRQLLNELRVKIKVLYLYI